MAQAGKFLRKTARGYAHLCPGCNRSHVIAVDAPNASGARWTFNGNLEKPTFSPSINSRTNMPDMKGYQPNVYSSICHYFLTDGRIQFLTDCTHALAGQTVALPELPLDMTDRYIGTGD